MGLPSSRMSSSCLRLCLCSSMSQKASLCMVSILLFWKEHTDSWQAFPWNLPSGSTEGEDGSALPTSSILGSGETEAHKAKGKQQ